MQANKDEVSRLARTTSRFAEAMRQGTTRAYDPVRVGVLQAAVEAGPLRAGEIAERLDALPSSITRHVQALMDSGLVITSPDPADRRAVLVEATEAGRAELEKFLEVGDQVFGAVIAEWPAEDVVTLTRLLDRLIESWGAAGAQQQQRATKRRPGGFGWSRI
ncbi:MarR family winged helix-turn-helix transcriptional regulator [Nocardia huaxiensis]|uniref:Winged helix-turn-helix transcriptional regulator n=1 Tax=Nocardia huaxiensis TaxID=2755382 RepID=A0A7D6VA63_9NOCA|nr:MarR family winged helix-turn-helix transcriptional regulator [Nocardia huaxiensis]QLY29382.1 winged helix-turn-helix transcriptional regulator [Nocardia huaxiensis]UFS97137.1 MarR family winged helix-turn-helix transcriptional regulator [Nocardia huaxiensis]